MADVRPVANSVGPTASLNPNSASSKADSPILLRVDPTVIGLALSLNPSSREGGPRRREDCGGGAGCKGEEDRAEVGG